MGGKPIKWTKTKYPGVRFWESQTRKHKGRADRCFVIRYKRHGRLISETVGWLSNGESAQNSSNIRGDIVSNIKHGQGYQSMAEKRQLAEAKERASETEAVTLQDAFTAFLETRTLKKSTIRDYRRAMRIAYPDWAARRVIDITRDSVAKRHRKLKADGVKNFLKKCKKKKRTPTAKEQERAGSAQANQAMRFLRSLLNFCAGYYEDAQGGPLIKFNPVQRLSQTKQWFRVQRKQTIIKPHELPAWFKAVNNLKNETARDYFLVLLLTGCRKVEALTLEVSQIDLQAKTLAFMDPKNSEPLILPLPKHLLKILKARIDNLGKSKYLFPGRSEKGHLADLYRQIQKVIETSKIKFTLHDLRRHFITTADGLDLSVFAIKRLVNHSIGGDVTGGYMVHDVERLRDPMQKVEDKILMMAGALKRGKVVPIRSA